MVLKSIEVIEGVLKNEEGRKCYEQLDRKLNRVLKQEKIEKGDIVSISYARQLDAETNIMSSSVLLIYESENEDDLIVPVPLDCPEGTYFNEDTKRCTPIEPQNNNNNEEENAQPQIEQTGSGDADGLIDEPKEFGKEELEANNQNIDTNQVKEKLNEGEVVSVDEEIKLLEEEGEGGEGNKGGKGKGKIVGDKKLKRKESEDSNL